MKHSLLLLLALWLSAPAWAQMQVQHELSVRLEPARQWLDVQDTVTLSAPPAGGVLTLLLNAGLALTSADPAYVLEPLPAEAAPPAPVPLRAYELRPAAGTWPSQPVFRLHWTGELHHQLNERQENYAKAFSETPGQIGPDGVLLGGAAYWLPWFGEETLTFSLSVNLPAGWTAVSQGARLVESTAEGRTVVTWVAQTPLDEVYLIANQFHEYSDERDGITAYAFLRQPEAALAGRYLGLTHRYLAMYQRLIGDYPYRKFALVENFWETGYGMPSFTLLGPQVLRLPFIPYTSYPHEILHNWWGNSVYVDYAAGNWAEGLTAYLADHLLKEQQGQGADYRRDALIAYQNFVREEREFPLTAFRSRHSSASQAIGYGKAAMLFHMLRRELGDEVFKAGLQRFYAEQRFRRAGWAELAAAFASEAGRNLDDFFRQWLERTGAPQLALAVQPLAAGLRVTVTQTQETAPYRLRVPLALTLAGEAKARLEEVVMDGGRTVSLDLALPAPVLRVDLDPAFDLFRQLAPGEVPVTLSALFGAEKITLILPAADQAGWQTLAAAWSAGAPGRVTVVNEAALSALPADGAVWVLGSNNRWRAPIAAQWADYQQEQPPAGHSFALAVRDPANPERVLGWIGTDNAAALPGLARKLPHYGKYSYLVFTGAAPDNVGKGQWPVLDSPLTVLPTGTSAPRAALPERRPLTVLPD